MEKPLVSVITITYNLIKAKRKDWFEMCIESVHNQNYENLEHIIIDGASDDGTIELLEKYEQKGFIKYYSKKDNGIFDAMNKGIDRANGEYIHFLNSDDFFHNSNGIRALISQMQAEQLDFIYSDVKNVSKNGSFLNIWKANTDNVYFGAFCCHQGMMVKKTALESIGKFDLKCGIAADVDMMQKLFLNNFKHNHSKEIFASYRAGGASQKDWGETRCKTAQVIYNNIGKNNGLTLFDCYYIWGFRFLHELNPQVSIMLGNKIKSAKLKEIYFNKLTKDIAFNMQKTDKIKKKNYLLLFFLSVLKSIRKRNKTKFLLLGFIPVCTCKSCKN